VVIELAAIPDVQALPDTRNLSIDRVGIRDIRQPVRIVDRSGEEQATIATFGMYVQLGPEVKGTHMSRFVEILEEHPGVYSLATFPELAREVGARLDATRCEVEMTFPHFMRKAAPVTGTTSTLDFEVTMAAILDGDDVIEQLRVQVPVTSLCPCSKTISDYGAHNQRSHVIASVELTAPLWIEDLIELLEDQGSCELYPILKRPDEKHVTEVAYDNPKFVEDIARDVALAFNADERIGRFHVTVENFESIHNHSAFAEITGGAAVGSPSTNGATSNGASANGAASNGASSNGSNGTH
jgi:GTP cyclohydrolase I